MAGDLAFRCDCGAVRGAVQNLEPRHGVRFVCYCDDCQVYAHHLGRSDRLDAHGGTDGYHADSSRLRIDAGLGELAALRVADVPGRPVLRWYCRGCRTPLFNTYSTAQRSLFGLLVAATDPGEADAVIGPPTGAIWRKFAAGDISAAKDANLPAIIWRLFRRQISARLSGDWRNTPLFDRETGRPIVEPYGLSAEERRAAEGAMAGFHRGRKPDGKPGRLGE